MVFGACGLVVQSFGLRAMLAALGEQRVLCIGLGANLVQMAWLAVVSAKWQAFSAIALGSLGESWDESLERGDKVIGWRRLGHHSAHWEMCGMQMPPSQPSPDVFSLHSALALHHIAKVFTRCIALRTLQGLFPSPPSRASRAIMPRSTSRVRSRCAVALLALPNALLTLHPLAASCGSGGCPHTTWAWPCPSLALYSVMPLPQPSICKWRLFRASNKASSCA